MIVAPLALLAGLLPVRRHFTTSGGFYVPPDIAREKTLEEVRPEFILQLTKEQMDDVLPESQAIIQALFRDRLNNIQR